MADVAFTDSDLYAQLEALTAEELDHLPFGVIQMESGGTVLNYNRFESNLSGLPPEQVIGQDFFVQVAPCTNNFMVREKYNVDGEDLDEQVPYVFTYKMAPTQVLLRLLSKPQGHWYLLVQTETAEG